MKYFLKILSFFGWFIERWITKRDEAEPQTRIDDARTHAATGADAALNADLDAAADRLRQQNHLPGDQQ